VDVPASYKSYGSQTLGRKRCGVATSVSSPRPAAEKIRSCRKLKLYRLAAAVKPLRALTAAGSPVVRWSSGNAGCRQVEITNQSLIIMNTNEIAKRPVPQTVNEKLDDIIKRLGRVEKHLIDIRGPRPARNPEPQKHA
jgi:hypothetical protein